LRRKLPGKGNGGGLFAPHKRKKGKKGGARWGKFGTFKLPCKTGEPLWWGGRPIIVCPLKNLGGRENNLGVLKNRGIIAAH